MMKWLFFTFLAVFCVVPIVAAQADCPAIVTTALNTALEVCTDVGRDQACYGNVSLQATPRANTPEFSFEQAGDVVNLADLEAITLNSMSLEDASWGIALMEIQANIPDESPENVTLVMFGNVNVANNAVNVVEIPMTATGNVNVRLRPLTDENNVMVSLTPGQEVIANGRLADNSWIRIEVEADARGIGWVSADFLASTGDIDTLNVVEPGTPQYRPMQAFTLATGVDDSPCTETPNSGILIQTPSGVGEISLLINEVNIRLGSTVYLQAAQNYLTVNVLEGFATLDSTGTTQGVPAGSFAQVPLDANGLANGAPSHPQPYTLASFNALPLSLLPQTIVVRQPRTQAQIDAILNPPTSTLSVGGTTASGSGTAAVSLILTTPCLEYTGTQDRWDYVSNMTFSPDGSQMSYGDWSFSRANDGSYFREEIYSTSPDNYTVWDYTFILTGNSISGQVTGDWVYSDCTVVYTVSGTYTP
jgi:hypothetical protein